MNVNARPFFIATPGFEDERRCCPVMIVVLLATPLPPEHCRCTLLRIGRRHNELGAECLNTGRWLRIVVFREGSPFPPFATRIDLSDVASKSAEEQTNSFLTRGLAALALGYIANIKPEDAVKSVTDGFKETKPIGRGCSSGRLLRCMV